MSMHVAAPPQVVLERVETRLPSLVRTLERIYRAVMVPLQDSLELLALEQESLVVVQKELPQGVVRVHVFLGWVSLPRFRKGEAAVVSALLALEAAPWSASVGVTLRTGQDSVPPSRYWTRAVCAG
jgi:hypothetical protein